MSENQTDEELMLAYRDGDAGAFDVLYRRHRARLYRFLSHETGSPAAGEELYQEVWMTLIRSRERYVVSAKFSTYLYQIAHSRLVDWFRSHGKVRLEALDEDAPEPPAEACWQPDRQLDQRQEADRLRHCLSQLPPQQREAFLLKEEGEFSLDDIAQLVGVNAETIKSRIRYAISKLRNCLGGLLA
ncbi:sigma-70 family RNA polymerase sigma factor [Parachitinimonas caeni]|uniref:Sigma-70 family RNA polymerase sigma factor n=1 Tax=Parachitinimonas caeni TaxID=3031301 RepID=A0ABT7DU60_9NEIS|nr:sigma-70 family RNA polymerase sigma factor [Parachitinimonas caeni]MDK2123617.1 sigma-70 family RNA polymerase sigma factor [Parachitinimonas caeni]